MTVGLAINSLDSNPIYGVREPVKGHTTGWYLWAGEYSEDPGFYQPVHVEHLENLLPDVLPYISLEPGFKFIIDRQGYEDVWRA